MNKGFILLEVLVSLIVLTTGILFLMQTLSGIVRSNQMVKENALAVLEVDNIFNRITAKEDIDIALPGLLDDDKFSIRREIVGVSSFLKEMMIEIQWKDRSNVKSVKYNRSIIDVENNL